MKQDNQEMKIKPFMSSYLVIITLFCALWLSACQSAIPAPTLTPTRTAAPTSTSTAAAPIATPAQTSIRIKKYISNYTAFKIEIQGGPTIITDPFLMDEKAHADIVTESHQHGDHTDVSSIVGFFKELKEAGSFNMAGVKITGVLGVHNKPYAYNLDNPNVIFVFEIGDIRIAQFGSQGDFPTQAMFDQIGKVDVLIIQIFRQHNSKLTMGEAEEIFHRLSARIMIPAHGDPGVNEEVAQHLGAEFKREPSGILNLSRSELDQLKKPVVLVLDR